MTLVEDENLQNLWKLVSELSSQLSANQQLTQSLQAQADELKGHALHSGTGYTLRRFNLDISKEKFESELEKVNSQLVVENQSLAHENKQISILLREYESTLETIMAKFRSFSHATQQHTLALTSHYENLLTNNAYEVANADLRANTAFSEHLTHLGSLVRLALREFEGESIEDHQGEQEHDEDPFEAEGYHVGSPSGVEPKSISRQSAQASSSSKLVTQKKAKQPYGSASGGDPRWYGTGGYTGLQGDPDAENANIALENRIEEERLKAENEMLRELLRVSADLTPEVAQAIGVDFPPPPTSISSTGGWPGANKLSLGKPRGSRKSMGDISTGAASSAEEKATDNQNEGSDHVLNPESETQSDNRNLQNESQLRESNLFPPSPAGVHTFATSGITGPPAGFSHVTSGSGGPPQLSETGDGSDIGLSVSNDGVLATPEELESNESSTIIGDSDSDSTSTSSTALGLQSMTAATSEASEGDLQDLAKNINKENDGEKLANTENAIVSDEVTENAKPNRTEALLEEIDTKLGETASDLKESGSEATETESQGEKIDSA